MIWTLRQQTADAGIFDGAAPADILTPTIHDAGIWDYAAAASSLGLFDPFRAGMAPASFVAAPRPVYVRRFEFFTTKVAGLLWTLYKVSTDGVSTWTPVYLSGVLDTAYFSRDSDTIFLLPGEYLKLVVATPGAGKYSIASVTFEDREIE